MTTHKLIASAFLALFALPATVSAQVLPRTDRRPRLQLSAGAGVADFAEDSARHNTTLGGTWDVRLAAAPDTVIGGEVAYVGTANGVNERMSLNAPNAVVLGNGLEAAARLQVPTTLREGLGRFSPYGFVGLGINRYSLVSESFRNGVAIDDGDTTLVVPLGLGSQFRLSDRFALDGRFTYRTMLGEDLLHVDDNGNVGGASQGLSQWTLAARVGYSF